MKPTISILLAPMVTFLSAVFIDNPTIKMTALITYLMLSLVCLFWGFYISHRSRFLGWLCVAVGITPLILTLIPARSA